MATDGRLQPRWRDARYIERLAKRAHEANVALVEHNNKAELVNDREKRTRNPSFQRAPSLHKESSQAQMHILQNAGAGVVALTHVLSEQYRVAREYTALAPRWKLRRRCDNTRSARVMLRPDAQRLRTPDPFMQ